MNRSGLRRSISALGIAASIAGASGVIALALIPDSSGVINGYR